MTIHESPGINAHPTSLLCLPLKIDFRYYRFVPSFQVLSRDGITYGYGIAKLETYFSTRFVQS